MYTDSRISAAIETMLDEIKPPPVPLAEIRRKIERPTPLQIRTPSYRRLAIALGAVAAGLVILFSSGLIQAITLNIEDRYRAALEAKGGYAPPPPPDSLRQQVMTEASSSPPVTIARAQTMVPFTIAQPVGLPRDVVSAEIRLTPALVNTPVTRKWQVGSRLVRFIYRRAGGSTFQIMADQFDPNAAPPGKYMFEAQEGSGNGQPVIVRHVRYEWRNGDQVMTAIADTGVSAPEIEAIRTAMHGIPIPGRFPNPPVPGTTIKFIPIP